MQKVNHKIHKIFLIAIFLLGNTVIAFPKGQGIEYAVIALAVAVLPTLFLISCIIKIKEIDSKLFIFLLAFFAFFTLLVSVRDYASFVDTVRLPKTPKLVILIIFSALFCFMGTLKNRVIYHFSLFSLIFTGIIFIFVLIFSINKLDFEYIIPDKLELSVLIRQSLTFFVHSFGQLIIPFYFIGKSGEENKNYLRFGTLLGFVLISVYVLNILLVLGGEVAYQVEYPYAALTSLVTFSGNYSRLDGFTYFVYFYSNLIKCSVCSNIIINSVKLKRKIAAALLATAIILILSSDFIGEFLNLDFVNFIILAFELLFPISLLVWQKFKNRQK